MKNLLITTLRSFTTNSTNSTIDFSSNNLSRQQLAAIKGGDDIVIRDIIGSNQGG